MQAARQSYADKIHVLVVDDDRRIRDLVTRYLETQDFVVMAASDTAQARSLLAALSFDIAVVDIMMPGETGIEFVRSFRQKSALPVLFLSALGEAQDRVAGFEAGGDDYLPKPFEPKELVLRLKAIVQRSRRHQEQTKGAALRIGRWRFDPDHGTLSDGQENIKLTYAEIRLIEVLASSGGEPVSREDLAVKCGLDIGSRGVDVQVTRLRRKIEDDTKAPRYLKTIRGKGYLLRAEP